MLIGLYAPEPEGPPTPDPREPGPDASHEEKLAWIMAGAR